MNNENTNINYNINTSMQISLSHLCKYNFRSSVKKLFILWLQCEPLLVGAGWPRHGLLLLVNVEAHGGNGVQPQPLLQHLADGHDGLGLRGVRQPHRQLVRPGTDVDHSSVNLVSVLVCVFSDEKENDFQPAGVEELLLVSSVEVDHPPSSVLVPRVLPVREDALLEEGLEVLHGGHRDDRPLVLLPGPGFVVLEEP